jgi:hypothetical protein
MKRTDDGDHRDHNNNNTISNCIGSNIPSAKELIYNGLSMYLLVN